MVRQTQAPVRVDFFGIGGAKCGSTWLAQCLDEHPAISIAEGKETNFFVDRLSVFDGDRNPAYMMDWGRYRALYRKAKPGDIRGDFSINMLHNVETAPAVMAEYYPDAKFVLILRNPVDRTYSHYWHERYYDRRRSAPRTFEEALESRELIFRSCYYEQLTHWLAYIELERFHFVFDFDLKHDRSDTLRRLFRFLGADPAFDPPSAGKRVNETVVRSPLVVALERAGGRVRGTPADTIVRLSRRLGFSRAVRLAGTRARPYPTMAPQVRERLRQMLSDDIDKLAELLGRQLKAWKE